jgi:transposase
LRRFNGIPREHFYLFLKECEWRFNHSDPKIQLKLLKQLVREHMG